MFEKRLEKFLENPSNKQKIVLIFGPTASGKTQMSLDIAHFLKSEIISTDSRQIFRGMDIGTGKILENQMQGIPHHMINILFPNQEFSMGNFVEESEKVMQKIFQAGKIPILAGGTGLYIDSLIFERNAPQIPANPEIRSSFRSLTNEELYQKLLEIDEIYAQQLHPQNRPYIERALEVKILTGKSKSEFRSEKILKYEVLFLHPGHIFLQEFPENQEQYKDIIFSQEYRKWLYERIDARVEKMFEAGLLGEVQSLLEQGYNFQDFGMNSIGYREFQAYFFGEESLEEVKKNIQQNSRNYAKRQLTWFKRYRDFL